jgi:uncharacterized protein
MRHGVNAQREGSNDLRVELLVLQPTPFCNIDCRYCYLTGRTDRRRMGDDLLALVGRRIIRKPWVGDELTVVWHAGEPLVLPPSYYDRAIALVGAEAPAGLAIRHGVQTNGTLITDAWIELFRRHDINVGISIDGPRALHDNQRVDRAGHGTYDAALSGLRRVAAAGLSFSIITVLSDCSLDHADALFAFYVDNGVQRVGFNIEEIEGGHITSSLQHQDIVARFRAFLERFWDLVDAHPGQLRVREFDAAVRAILDPNHASAGNPLTEPLRTLTVDVDGNMSTFSPELLGALSPEYGNFRFGNVRAGGPDLLLRHPSFLRTRMAVEAGIAECRTRCAYFPLCRGGAPANKLFETGQLDTTETLYCRLARQAVIEVALGRLERQLLGAGAVAPAHRSHRADAVGEATNGG